MIKMKDRIWKREIVPSKKLVTKKKINQKEYGTEYLMLGRGEYVSDLNAS